MLYWGAGLSIFSLVAHAIDAPDHLNEWWGYGTFFVIIAAFQFFLGIALLIRPWRYDENGNIRGGRNDRFGKPYYNIGIILSSAIVVVYLITRTSGMPFLGPEASREPVTLLSLIPPVVNIPLIIIFANLSRRSRQSETETSKA
jgi:hypothetical protein